MRRIIPLLFLLVPFAASADDNKLLSYWVQIAPGGGSEARAVTSGSTCPIAVVFKDYAAHERVDVPFTVRAPASADFPLVCSATIPDGANTAWIAMSKEQGDARQRIINYKTRSAARAVFDTDGQLPLLRRDPERILVLGDTGCRIKDTYVQACNDPVQWPFQSVANAAAKWWPDLVIHVGDYLYRESPCPAGNTGCAGSPYGDNWTTWSADFFGPGKTLLAAAPFVVVRGNHEDCPREGAGFLRLLGPVAFDPSAPCIDHLAAYNIPLDGLNLAVMDTANAPDTSVDPGVVPEYQSEFAALASATAPTWLLMHRPIWGAVCQTVAGLCMPVGGNQTLIAALAGGPMPKPVELMLAGHIHAFEAINYKSLAPPAILSGNGGDNLDTTPTNLKGTVFGGSSGVKVKDGLSVPGFGFLMMTREGKSWKIDLFDATGVFERECLFADGRVDCPKPKD